MNCLNCQNENTRDYPVCPTCEPACHFEFPKRDCLCDSCREKRASEYPELNLVESATVAGGVWAWPPREVAGAFEHEGALHILIKDARGLDY